MKGDRYFVPLWVVVPASKVQFKKSSDKEKATLDLLAVVRDFAGNEAALEVFFTVGD